MGVGFGLGIEPQSGQGVTDVWLTPPEILKALGPFDLDPCAADPRPWPTATRMIALPEDGLHAEWLPSELVWLNPPYGKETGQWLAKLKEHGHGIALVFARTDTDWFQQNIQDVHAAMFLAGRVSFCRPDGEADTNAGAPSCLLAYGSLAADRLFQSGLDGVLAGMFLKRGPQALQQSLFKVG